jgi:hypothetical protein
MEEELKAAFSVRFTPRLHKGSIRSCEFGSEASRELSAEVRVWQLEASPARELAAEVPAAASGQSMRLG